MKDNYNLTPQKLNPRQWKLHDFFETHEQANVQDVCNALPEFYSVHITDGNYSNCPKLYEDINTLNESSQTDKIIVIKNNCFFRGTKDETEAYRNKLKIKALKAFKKYWNVDKKIKADGQGKLIGNNGDPITEDSSAREFIETFVRESNHGEE